MTATIDNSHNDLPLTAVVPPPLPEVPAALQKRPVIGIASGLLLIGFLLFIVMIFAFGLYEMGGIFGLLLASPIVLFFGGLALMQYLSLFCCRPWQTRCYYEMSFVFGGFALFSLVSSVPELRANGPAFLWYALPSIAVEIVLMLLFLTIGEVNRRSVKHRRQLAAAHSLPLSMPMKAKFTLYKGRTFAGLLMVVLVPVLLYLPYQPVPASGEHLTYAEFPYKSFPASGSDFSYKNGVRGTKEVEFTIAADDLKQWLASDYRWEPIKEGDAGFGTSYDPNPSRHNGGRVSIDFDRKTSRAKYRAAYH